HRQRHALPALRLSRCDDDGQQLEFADGVLRRRQMSISRRDLIAGAALGLGAGVRLDALAATAKESATTEEFLWGTAISAYQSEGGNYNTDHWVLENIKPTLYTQPSDDACDSYHRYAEDFALAAKLGFNCYRFGIEWSRIEPREGFFSNAELDHYAKMLES